MNLVTIGYRVRCADNVWRFVWKSDVLQAKPVHAPEGFDPVAFGRQLALEDKQKLKDAITRWRGIQQSVADGSLSRDEQLVLSQLVERCLDDLMSEPGAGQLG